MPRNIIEKISNWRDRNKNLSKYQKPHCIVPIEDFQWVTNQTKAVQKLWGECWTVDPYGSRWVRINTTLSDRSFREAKKRLYAAGLFEFKPNPSPVDGRLTDGWLVKNLHGARRINDYWNQEPDEQEYTQENHQQIDGINLPDDGINLPDDGGNLPNDGKKLPAISPETIENTRVPEPLSNSSLTSQEHLKDVPETVEEIATDAPFEGGHRCNQEQVDSRQKSIEKFEKVAKECEEEVKNLLSLEQPDWKLIKKLERQAKFHRSIIDVLKRPMPKWEILSNKLLNEFGYKIDNPRLDRFLELQENQQLQVMEKLRNVFKKTSQICGTVIDSVLSEMKNITNPPSQLAYDV